VSNTATSITVDLTNKLPLTSVAAVGSRYSGIHRFDNLYMQRCGSMIAGDQLFVPGTVSIGANSVLTHYDATPGSISMIDLTAGILEVDSSGSINVDARGYLGGGSGGNPDGHGRTAGNLPGSASFAGGSNGGLGGSIYGGVPNPVYGLNDPMDLGSGGGTGSCSRGGDGGGLILIDATNVVMNGAISANGEAVGCGAPGSGSGGTIHIAADTVSGSGSIIADGAAGDVGGGGGRIFVLSTNPATLTGTIDALGGLGGSAHGQNGTVYIPNK
jgi:hypothetical protein